MNTAKKPSAVSGYSGTPLVKKLGLKTGARMLVINAPVPYDKLLGGLPEGVVRLKSPGKEFDFAHAFAKQADVLAAHLRTFRDTMAQEGMVWVSWPKKASGVTTDITEDTVRALALPLGMVDIKVCAIDGTWSGLKLVIRKELRSSK